MIRQILGAVSQFEKTPLVAKLAGARMRKRQDNGRCEGPKQAPDAARALAQTLRAEGLALRAIAARLAEAGFVVKSGAAYGAESVKRMPLTAGRCLDGDGGPAGVGEGAGLIGLAHGNVITDSPTISVNQRSAAASRQWDMEVRAGRPHLCAWTRCWWIAGSTRGAVAA
jgi:hypothetical protein